jgi:hypothetical protein
VLVVKGSAGTPVVDSTTIILNNDNFVRHLMKMVWKGNGDRRSPVYFVTIIV